MTEDAHNQPDKPDQASPEDLDAHQDFDHGSGPPDEGDSDAGSRSSEKSGEGAEHEAESAQELEQDPAYNPQEDVLRDIKGG